MLFNTQSFGLQVKTAMQIIPARNYLNLFFNISIWQQLPSVMKQKLEPKLPDTHTHTMAIPTDEQEKVSLAPMQF